MFSMFFKGLPSVHALVPDAYVQCTHQFLTRKLNKKIARTQKIKFSLQIRLNICERNRVALNEPLNKYFKKYFKPQSHPHRDFMV